ncbi:MAG: DUF2520 domain-containing protein [Acidobacteria bacterium]|nr:DUF2520 domain-containing protein [Acidobacteriota bacterium]
MTQQTWVGLLAAGPVSPSLYQLAHWNAVLGPVCAETLRVASRLANRMRAGHAARTGALDACQLVLLSGPADAIAGLIGLAANADVQWRGKTVLLVDTPGPAGALSRLGELGAFIGTLDPIDAFATPYFFADADPASHRLITRFGAATKSKVFIGAAGGKPAFRAGASLVSSLLTPLYAGALQAMKHSGLSQGDALAVAERLVEDTLRAWRKAGRKAWDGTIEPPGESATPEQAAALRVRTETLASFLSAAAALGVEHYESTNERNGP